MNVSEFIFDFLVKKGVDNVFAITGGQAMYLDDALARRPEIRTTFTHHEQTCGMSADAYARISGKLGVALVTAGPGSINVINGLVGAWCDSAPIMVISGQSAYSCVKYQEESGIRQYGIQGIYIKPFVEHATKFFVTVDDPAKILYYMEKAYALATSGRPGPVWIDVPLDVQRMQIPDNLLYHFSELEELDHCNNNRRQDSVCALIKMLERAKRPLIIAGQGIKISKSTELLQQFIEKYQIPIITTRLGIDVINSDHPLYMGRPGNYGERSANITVQNADLIIAIGSRLSTASIGHDSSKFGKHAKKAVIDIDEKELNKPIFPIDLKINDDAHQILNLLLKLRINSNFDKNWLAKCQAIRKRYPVVLNEYRHLPEINSYYFAEILSNAANKDTTVVVDTGSCFHVICQAWKIKQGQNFITTGGLSSMGWWVACIGAHMADCSKNTIVVTGDGSLQMNIQEFATIRHNQLPIKVFILNNNGYLLIRQTQKNFMNGRLFGEGPNSGVWCPDSMKIAEAYGIKGISIDDINELKNKVQEVLSFNGPVICDVKVMEDQLLIPRVSSKKMADGTLVSSDFEDMYPFLDDDELKSNLIDY